jgi:hypothetical protein
MGEILVEASVRNKHHESNLGLIRILPLVVWGLELDDIEFHLLIRGNFIS